jgi:hypothetical protein
MSALQWTWPSAHHRVGASSVDLIGALYASISARTNKSLARTHKTRHSRLIYTVPHTETVDDGCSYLNEFVGAGRGLFPYAALHL